MKKTWNKLAFDEAVTESSKGNRKTNTDEYLKEGKYPIVDQGESLICGYTDDPDRLCKSPVPTIVFGDHTRRFKYIDFPFCIGADGTKVLTSKPDIDTKYLYHYMRTLRIPNAGYSRHFKFLRRHDIYFPVLDEQRRIAAVLDQADALRTQRREALTQLDELTQSIFLDMFGNPLFNRKSWPTLSFRECGQVTTGATPPRDSKEAFGQHIEWLKPDNIIDDLEHPTESKEGLSELGVQFSKVAPPGALLIVCIAGSPNSIGRAALLDRKAAYNQQINALIPRKGNPRFLYHQIVAGKRLIQSQSSGGMKGIVSKSRLEQVRLMYPPEKLQEEFARRIESVERMKQQHRAHLARLDELFASLQDRAFRGDLVRS
ncbi:restriction endonuclease subunit S [Saccharopolyspora shandongensis]|uniref:restriction endonuclease subunit S n=1 Tax=Saccharopolyspora shandongensis TaxID=418495 RepID=UPI0033F9CEC6